MISFLIISSKLPFYLFQARAGLTSAVDVLKVVQAFENETNYTVWSDLASNLASVGLCLQYTDFYDLFKAFGRSVFGGVAAKLGWDKKEGEGESL